MTYEDIEKQEQEKQIAEAVDNEVKRESLKAQKAVQAKYQADADAAWLRANALGLPDSEIKDVFTKLKSGQLDQVNVHLSSVQAGREQKIRDEQIRANYRSNPDDAKNYREYMDYLKRK
jgi:hypothetical protein